MLRRPRGVFPAIIQRSVFRSAYHVPYRAILPKPEQCVNLLVPVALSCTHVAIASLRIEATWMVIGQAAGIAAAQAAQRSVPVHQLPYPQLRERLLARGQAEMTRDLDGSGTTGRERVFAETAIACKERDPERRKTLVCLLDGERALREMAGEWLPRPVGVLDLFHVLERLWLAAHCFHADGSDEAKTFVQKRLMMLLAGKVGYLVGGLRRLRDQHGLRGEALRRLNAAIVYYENNREHMRYDEYPAAGYPIGSGFAEGACRHLVKDRMEGMGMRWTVKGAQAMGGRGGWRDPRRQPVHAAGRHGPWQPAERPGRSSAGPLGRRRRCRSMSGFWPCSSRWWAGRWRGACLRPTGG